MKINIENLPISEENLNSYDLFIERYPSGHLFRFGEIDGWCLTIEEHKNAGVAEGPGSGGTNDSEIYSGGAYEVFDAWSDNSKPVKCSYETWVLGWIQKLCAGALRSREQTQKGKKIQEEIRKNGRRSVIKVVK